MSQRGQIESMNGKLIDPEILHPSVWRLGKPKLNEAGAADLPADFRCSLQAAEWVMTDLFANTSIVKPSEIASWKDLLKPQYKGKIAAYDPRRSGPGQTPVGYLAALFGNDYLNSMSGSKCASPPTIGSLRSGSHMGNTRSASAWCSSPWRSFAIQSRLRAGRLILPSRASTSDR
jgi:Bacterial extracellular solute-binding protein